MASNAKALSFLSGDLSLSGTEVSINVAGSVQSDSITGSTITMKNTGSTIVASDGTTAVLSESGGTVTFDVDVSTIGSATISGGSITGTEIDLKSSGTTIFASDGTTAVLSESGGAVTLTADEANVGSNALVVDSSGNVGIGTSTPNGALTVTGAVASFPNIGDAVQIGAAGGYSSIEMSGSTGGLIDFNAGDGNDFKGRIIYDNNNHVLDFHTNSAFKMRIDSSGNVGIGMGTSVTGGRYLDIYNTGSSSTDFSVLRLITQQVGSSSTTSADIYKKKDGQFTIANYETDSAAYTSFHVGASERMRIDSSGNINLSNNYNFARVRPTNSISFNDDASIQVTSATCGSSIVSVYDFASGHGISCFVCYASTAIILGNSANATNSDTDGYICLYKNANSHTTYVKNRLGSTRTFSVSVIGAYTHS